MALFRELETLVARGGRRHVSGEGRAHVGGDVPGLLSALGRAGAAARPRFSSSFWRRVSRWRGSRERRHPGRHLGHRRAGGAALRRPRRLALPRRPQRARGSARWRPTCACAARRGSRPGCRTSTRWPRTPRWPRRPRRSRPGRPGAGGAGSAGRSRPPTRVDGAAAARGPPHEPGRPCLAPHGVRRAHGAARARARSSPSGRWPATAGGARTTPTAPPRAGSRSSCRACATGHHRAGLHVLTVKPGFVDTPMTAHVPRNALFAHPRDVARSIVRAADARRDVVYVPWFWRWIMLVVRSIPERVFKRLEL